MSSMLASGGNGKGRPLLPAQSAVKAAARKSAPSEGSRVGSLWKQRAAGRQRRMEHGSAAYRRAYTATEYRGRGSAQTLQSPNIIMCMAYENAQAGGEAPPRRQAPPLRGKKAYVDVRLSMQRRRKH